MKKGLLTLPGFVMLIACCLFAGCGYHLATQGGASPLLSGKRIAIPIFANKSYRPNLESLLTEQVIREFALRSGALVMSSNDADILLNGTVTAYTTVPVSYSSKDKITEYRADITLEATLVERGSRKVLWTGKISDRQEYPAEADISLQMNREVAATREICRKLALKLYLTIGQDF